MPVMQATQKADQEDEDWKPNRPYLENTQHKKRAGRVAQVVESLPCKNEALSSIHSTTKQKHK
jgi:hypothetical protein